MSSTTRRPAHHHHHRTAFASSSAALTSRYPAPTPSSFLHRSSSPTRVSLSPQPSQSIRFSLDRPASPASSRHISVSPAHKSPRRTCMCSPTTHPGSFRCSLHKSCGLHPQPPRYSPNSLHARRSAMTNSLVRICGVEGGDLVKRALAALIRPSSHHQRRRAAFQPRPSRLSVMSMD